MKKHLSQLILLVPLLFVAGISFAAYSYVGPTAAPTGNNTEGPLDVSASDQVKNGGLSVNAFYVPGNAYFDQDAYFHDMVLGGSNNGVMFGSGSSRVSVANVGNTTISGQYQSETLKTGGGKKPVCAKPDGTFYLCDGSEPAVATTTTTTTGGTTPVQTPSNTPKDITLTLATSSACTGNRCPSANTSGRFTISSQSNNVGFSSGTSSASAILSESISAALSFNYVVVARSVTTPPTFIVSSVDPVIGPTGQQFNILYTKYVKVTPYTQGSNACFKLTDPATGLATSTTGFVIMYSVATAAQGTGPYQYTITHGSTSGCDNRTFTPANHSSIFTPSVANGTDSTVDGKTILY